MDVCVCVCVCVRVPCGQGHGNLSPSSLMLLRLFAAEALRTRCCRANHLRELADVFDVCKHLGPARKEVQRKSTGATKGCRERAQGRGESQGMHAHKFERKTEVLTGGPAPLSPHIIPLYFGLNKIQTHYRVVSPPSLRWQRRLLYAVIDGDAPAGQCQGKDHQSAGQRHRHGHTRRRHPAQQPHPCSRSQSAPHAAVQARRRP